MTTPNIILINCDDLGYGDLGCFGSTRNKTPNIDSMARDGIRLTDFYSASPVCSASRAALMTGCYPNRLGFGPNPVLFPGDPIGLHPDEITFPRILRENNYRTKIIGKWHCGDQLPFLPKQHGFEEYYGLPYSNDMGMQGQNSKKKVPLPLMHNNEVLQQQPDQRGLTERYTEQAVRFIRKNNSRPFFLYLAHMYVHVPLFVPTRFMEQSNNGGYGGAVECIDWVLGVIDSELKQAGLFDNTLVIFTSDNGSRARNEGGSNSPLRSTKATTWEGGQRVPCIMRWPSTIPANQVSRELTTMMDLYPTITKLTQCNITHNNKIDGHDISPIILGNAGATSSYDCFAFYWRENLEAVRWKNWKLHFAKKETSSPTSSPLNALYNLKTDPSESENLYKEHPEIVQIIEKKADGIRYDLGDKLTNTAGIGQRLIGRVDNPKPLTSYSKDHPYIVAAYDNADMPTMVG